MPPRWLLSLFWLQDHQLIRRGRLGVICLGTLTAVMLAVGAWAWSEKPDLSEEESALELEKSLARIAATEDPEKLRAYAEFAEQDGHRVRSIFDELIHSTFNSLTWLSLAVAILLANLALLYLRARELALELQDLRAVLETEARPNQPDQSTF